MTCEVVKLGDGTSMISCSCGSRGRVAKSERCGWCERRGTKLCDQPVGDGKTCDRRICPGHASHVEPNRDYCPDHKL
jgi:hypothetical protein